MHNPVRWTAWLWLAGGLSAAPAAAQQSLQVDAYLQDGAKHSARFFSLQNGQIQMALDGGQRQIYTQAQVPLLVFDDRYTNFDSDRETTQQAYPHTIVFKDGRVLHGTALDYYISGAFLALIEGQRQTYNAVDVARIYFDPRAFFAQRGGGPADSPTLKRNQAFLKLVSGDTLTQEIEDIRGGKERYYALKGGRRIPMDDVVFINFDSAEDLSRSDRDRLKRDQATFFMRDGRVIHGVVRDLLGDQAFELEDGTRIPLREISRVYFR
ncbi:MAG TPA: hypothetical protein VGB99_05745 [Acidobacteriota bacterium]|jgi:hypothetical protein